jgi:hypothetical protein
MSPMRASRRDVNRFALHESHESESARCKQVYDLVLVQVVFFMIGHGKGGVVATDVQVFSSTLESCQGEASVE